MTVNLTKNEASEAKRFVAIRKAFRRLFFPVRAVVIESDLAPEKARANLAAAISPREITGTDHHHHHQSVETPFFGTFEGSSFRVRRVSQFHQSWMHPEIEGRLEANGQGCSLAVAMRVPKISQIVFTVWLLVSFLLGGRVAYEIAVGISEPPSLIFVSAFLAVPFIFNRIEFSLETRRAEKAFREIIEARTGSAQPGN